MKHYLLISIYSLIIFSACGSKTAGDNENMLPVTKFDVDVSEQSTGKDWQSFSILNDNIFCPIDWKLFPQDKVMFFTQINDSDKNTFFTVVRYDQVQNDITLESYIKLGYSQLKNDSVEVFTGYSLKELAFENKQAFYGEYSTVINKVNYYTFAMYFIEKGFVYDLSLKVRKSDKDKYYNTFQSILYSYKTDDRNVFNEDDEIKSIRIIDLANW